ncbi:MAG: trypsin-like peptidase domain-containing protein [Planctomycetota bacterium]|nr:trypsin-like peptidase domain-containing protein [Planctomycetota bacterium]
MYRTLLIGITAASPLLVMGVTRQSNLERRLNLLEEFTQEVPARQDQALRSLTSRVNQLPEGEQVDALHTRVHSLESRLMEAREALKAQRETLDDVSQIAHKVRRIDALEQGMDSRWAGFVRALDATATLVDETRAELGDVRSQISESGHPQLDPNRLWSATVGPTVQLRGSSTVGSGVLLQSRPAEENPETYRTLMLTSWHVIRDIRADSHNTVDPIPVFVRDLNGAKSEYTATVLDHNVELDAALLILDTNEPFEVGAMLPTRHRLGSTEVFDDVVAVGCPLGNDPIPTQGQLTDLYHEVEDARFWMISAPTYIGNSGGGIYGLDSHELLGIFSKIYTHGSIRPTVIPHMGLVTPLGAIYDWIDESGVASIAEGAGCAVIVLD